MIVFSRNLLSAKTNQAAGLHGNTERQQDDRLLLQLLGMAMSRQGPLLQQEDEDDGRNGDEDCKGWDDDRMEKIQELHAACC